MSIQPGAVHDEKHPDFRTLIANIQSEVERLCKKGVKRFMTGACAGVDIWAGEVILNLMRQGLALELYSVIPFKDQAIRWTLPQQKRYQALLSNSSKTILLSDKYYDGCYRARNYYLITHARYLIAVCGELGGIRSGTQQTINMAMKNGNEIIYANY